MNRTFNFNEKIIDEISCKKELKFNVYGEPGAQNHGNEAIIKGLKKLFPNSKITVYTYQIDADKHFNLDTMFSLKPFVDDFVGSPFRKIMHYVLQRIKVFDYIRYRLRFAPFLKDIKSGETYLFEAGDQYCEPGDVTKMYAWLNRQIKQKGGKTVMMACSVNPSILNNKKIVEDIKNYSLVIARETQTYNAFKHHDIDAKLAPCPAFAMDTETYTDNPFSDKECIGFNVGFLVQGSEVYYSRMMANYKNAIKYVIENTDYDVALIPHIHWSYQLSDYQSLDVLYNMFKNTGRIHYVYEHSAPEQKYYISKCKLFVTLRIHASIAAFSSCTPLIISAYSIKAKGISEDIFNDKFDILVNVNDMEDDFVLKNKIQSILPDIGRMKSYMEKQIPEYIRKLDVFVGEIENLVDGAGKNI